MPYQKINWQNGEAGGTPLNATNLNKMDAQIDANTTAIATNTADIAEIKRNTEFNLTSASPLNGCSASSIVGIDACGNSTQSGTPTPTNPIAIVDASGDVVAHTINLCNIDNIVLGKSWDATTVNASRGYVEITDVVVGETYTLSAVSLNGLSSISAMPLSGNNLVGSAKTVDANTSSVSFTIASTVDKIRILYVAPSGTLTKAMAEATKTMFCKGTSTDYVSYASNKITLPTLRSVGDVKDELIVNADGSGQIVRRVGVKTITTVDEVINENQDTAYSKNAISDGNLPNYTTNYICSHASANSISASDTREGSYVFGNSIRFRKSDLKTKTAWDAWLATNTITVYYPLAIPTTTTLTASEVSAIRALQTYSGTTIVDSALDVKSVTYHADTKAYIDGRTDYSYSDTVIGKWADGKPLHRMVISATTPSSTSGGVVAELPTSAIVKNIYGMIYRDGYSLPFNAYLDANSTTAMWMASNSITVKTTSNWASKPCEITVEYTLKNESAISVLSDDSEYYGQIETPDDENIIGVITEG